MAEEKDKKVETPEAVPKKKSRLMPVALVAAGAMLGGAGVVLLGKPPAEQRPAGPPIPRIEVVHYPDQMEFRFNPKSDKGNKSARVVLKLDIEVDLNRKTEIEEALKARWDRAKSRVLLVLKDQPHTVFSGGSDQLIRLSKEIVDELTASLFPEGQARVKDVLYTDVMLLQ